MRGLPVRLVLFYTARGDMEANALLFSGYSFCFTGAMSELKRTQAEREVRARGGLTCNVINERLTYLVIGDTPSPGWKHGNYGRKIEKAREIAPVNGGHPRLISESIFMQALAAHPPTNSGAIDTKVVVCNYKFLAPTINDVDVPGLERWLEIVHVEDACHISLRSHYAIAYGDLYGGENAGGGPAALVVECRIVKQMSLSESAENFLETIERGFEAIRGVDGRLGWFERSEGSADYIRLLKEIPSNLQLVER